MSKVYCIIVAGGSSYRFGKEDKLMSDLAGKPVIWHTINSFQIHKAIDEIIIVASKENKTKITQIADNFPKVKKILTGGKTRQESSYIGLKSLQADEKDVVLVHNGANPLTTKKGIDCIIKATRTYGSAAIGRPLSSTLKKVDAEGLVVKTVERKGLWTSETPQGMKYSLAMQAYTKAEKENFEATDDVQIVEHFGHKVRIFECSPQNMKITNPEDLHLANLILQKSGKSYVGLGQDSHRFFNEEKPLILGNYQVSETGGLEGNSDGDVIIHALCNALSSAIGGHSLSNWSDKMCKEGTTDSKFYLKKIHEKVVLEKYKINNISLALEAAKPKLEKHLPEIQKKLATLLNLETRQIGITVTSGESLSDFGKGLGIQCFCFLSLIKQS